MIEEIIEVPVEETTMRCTCIGPNDGCTSCPVGTNSLEQASGYINGFNIPMTDERMTFEEFDTHIRGVIKYLCDNQNPHTVIMVECDGYEILQGIKKNIIHDYIRD